MSNVLHNQEMDLSSGIAAFETKQFAQSMQLLSPLADMGSVEAQYRMAIMLQNGLGMVANEEKAFNYMKAAAEKNHALSQHGLGFMYLEGECTKQNSAEAAVWFRKAADQGLIGSLTTLASMYEQGQGVEKDMEKAQALYKEAGF